MAHGMTQILQYDNIAQLENLRHAILKAMKLFLFWLHHAQFLFKL